MRDVGSPPGAEPATGPVAVLIVTYNSEDDLPGCLESVAAQDHRPLEVVVVDCASSDGSVAAARAFEAGELPLEVVALGENRGFAGGMNEALRHTDAPAVLALNADARPAPDFVSRLLARLEACRDLPAAAVTGRLVRPPGGESGERLLDACGMRLTRTWRHLDRGSGEVDRGQFAVAERVFGATGAATLYRRDALDDVAFGGGEVFDSLFHSYREDAELCFRFHERGWQVVYEPAAVAEHRRRVVPANRRQVPAFVNRHSLKNRYLLRAYHQTARNALATALATLARDLAALAWVLVAERTSLGAYAWLWRHRRQIWQRRRWVQGRRTAPSSGLDRWFRHRALPLPPASGGLEG